jgi:hypothetical protein
VLAPPALRRRANVLAPRPSGGAQTCSRRLPSGGAAVVVVAPRALAWRAGGVDGTDHAGLTAALEEVERGRAVRGATRSRGL